MLLTIQGGFFGVNRNPVTSVALHACIPYPCPTLT